jgi:DNA replicative helicase MCM subunit Mcm2 (Cdc46/Mcm family)
MSKRKKRKICRKRNALWEVPQVYCQHFLFNSDQVLPCFQSDQMSRLVKIPGIVISSSEVKAKATQLALQCRGCSNVISKIHIKPGLEGYVLPRKCNT